MTNPQDAQEPAPPRPHPPNPPDRAYGCLAHSVLGESQKDPALDAINASLGFDRRLWREDLDGSRAHVRMLGAQGILTATEVEEILAGLDRIAEEILGGTFPFRLEHEDIHLNVEVRLTELIGDVGKKLHTGRSRNDQVATDVRLWVKRRGQEIDEDLTALATALLEAAERELQAGTALPFYTHLQRAQPVLLAHHLLAHLEALERDRGRLGDALRRADECPLGAAAGAGAAHAIDPVRSAGELGFARCCRSSLDAVSARDFCLELLSALAILGVHLSRIAEELILWSSAEFGFCRLSDAVTTGSSIMPQKKNPDGAELVRAKAGRIAGRLTGLLMTVKALPLAYHKDLQEDKEALFDAVDSSRLSLRVLAASIRGARFDRERMRQAVEAREGYANATELADYLVRKCLPFREAYEIVKRLVRDAAHHQKKLEDLSLPELRAHCAAIDDDVYEALTLESALARRQAPMGTAPVRVREALGAAKARWR